MQQLPAELYSVKSVSALEQVAIKQHGIPAYELMQRAGKAVFDLLGSRYADCRRVLVLCGAGNNGGDGYVVAKLAKEAGYAVEVISLIDPLCLKGEALQAYQDWLSVGENATADESVIDSVDIVIDALLGTGLKRTVEGIWAKWIARVNQSKLPVISVDIPSGLFADTGAISDGGAIHATCTVSFIGLKQGMMTAYADDYCGEIIYDRLALGDEVISQRRPDAILLSGVDEDKLGRRKASSNKGDFGHALIVGGNSGMPGAVILAASAALRCGAGRVTVITISEHLTVIAAAVPEAMIKVCDKRGDSIEELFDEAFIAGVTHVAIGMGLGQDDWSQQVLYHCLKLKIPMVIDADALNLLAAHRYTVDCPVIITPHPGEARRLLGATDATMSESKLPAVQSDRFQAIRNLHALFNTEAVVVLKGAGSLVFDGEQIKICGAGNAAMATAGMGDVLSGIIVALLAQGLSQRDAAEAGVCLHASVADRLAHDKTRGLLASDVVSLLPEVLR